MSEMSSALQRRESECKAQELQMAETRRELEAARAEIAGLKRTKDALEAAGTRGRAERLDLDEQVMLLRESLDVTTKTLEEEKSAKKKLRVRLGTLEEEVARAAERARLAEGNAKAKSAAVADAKAALTRQASTAKELQTLQRLLDETSSDVEQLRSEVDSARAETESARERLVAVEDASRAQAREASHARERLEAEKNKLAHVSKELEVKKPVPCRDRVVVQSTVLATPLPVADTRFPSSLTLQSALYGTLFFFLKVRWVEECLGSWVIRASNGNIVSVWSLCQPGLSIPCRRALVGRFNEANRSSPISRRRVLFGSATGRSGSCPKRRQMPDDFVWSSPRPSPSPRQRR